MNATSSSAEQACNAATLPRLLMISNFLSHAYGTRSVQQDVRDRLVSLGYTVVTASSIRNGAARGSHMLGVALARRRDYDVATVDVYSGRAFLWADALSRMLLRLRCPFILMLHGGNLPQLAALRPARFARCLARADAVTAPSPYLRETLRFLGKDIQLLPNGVDLDRCVYRPRRHLAPRLVWLRAMHSVYNPVMAVETLAVLKSRYPGATLTMIGPDKRDGTLGAVRDAIARHRLEASVHIQGSVNKQDVPDCLQDGDIFLNTTNVDNTPVSVLEAMACGLPVVSTDVGGLPYLLHNGRDGLLVPAGLAQFMAAAVTQLLENPALAAEISARGRAMVEPFCWPVVINGWRELLDHVTQCACPPRHTPSSHTDGGKP